MWLLSCVHAHHLTSAYVAIGIYLTINLRHTTHDPCIPQQRGCHWVVCRSKSKRQDSGVGKQRFHAIAQTIRNLRGEALKAVALMLLLVKRLLGCSDGEVRG